MAFPFKHQFRLRTLFLVTLGAAIGFAVVVFFYHRDIRREATARHLRASGIEPFLHLAPWWSSSPTSIVCDAKRLDRELLNEIASYDLQTIAIGNVSSTTVPLDVLGDEGRLYYVSLECEDSVHEAIDVKWLERLPRLRYLCLRSCRPASSARFSDLRLESLEISGFQIDDESLEILGEIKTLRWVNIRNTRATHAGIERWLRALPSLERVTVGDRDLAEHLRPTFGTGRVEFGPDYVP